MRDWVGTLDGKTRMVVGNCRNSITVKLVESNQLQKSGKTNKVQVNVRRILIDCREMTAEIDTLSGK